jgi:hypothetical protein
MDTIEPITVTIDLADQPLITIGSQDGSCICMSIEEAKRLIIVLTTLTQTQTA